MLKNFFSFDSKFFQIMFRIFQWMILNVLFLIFCVPVFTIGASSAGMINAGRVLQDPEDDSYAFKAFLRGFTNGFWKITIIWTSFSILIGGLLYILATVIYLDAILENGPIISACIGLALSILLQSMTIAFHSRFECTVWQIIRSAFFMVLMHPLRAIGLGLLIWAPGLFALGNLYLFFQLTPVWLLVYYGAAFECCARLIKTPFKKIEDQFLANK